MNRLLLHFRWLLLAFVAAGLLACGDSDGAHQELDAAPDAGLDADDAPDTALDSADADALPLVEPASGSSFGHFRIALDIAAIGVAPDDVLAVSVGGVAAYDLAALDDGRLGAVVQGRAEPGPAEVVVVTDAGEVELGASVDYAPPRDPVFARVVAIGASLTQGVQRGVPSFHGSLAGPVTDLARQAGAYFPLPLLKPGLFPQLTPDDVGPAPDCATPNILDFISERAADVLPSLRDPDTGAFGYQYGRVDPTLEVYNLAVGGSVVGDVLRGPASDNLGGNFVSHLVYDPFGPFLSAVDRSQLDWVEALEPTVIVCVDLFGNDIIGALFLGDEVDVSLATPAEALLADIDAVVERLAATGAEVFLATLPQPTLLPAAADRARQMADAGIDDVAERMQAVDDLADQGNAALIAAAGRFDTVHVVDFAAALAVLAEAGELVYGGETFSGGKFGGLVGLDGVHFTDTGYALLANLIIDAVNAELDTDVPHADVDAVARDDVERPSVVRAAGLDIAACE